MPNNVFHVPFVKDDESKAFDMHVHTTGSDGLTEPKTLAKYLKKYDFSAAVTDHNGISGAKQALEYNKDIIPAIEVSALEGPHVLVYFDTYRDLASYYTTSIQEYRGTCPHMAVNRSTEKVINDAKNAGGFVIAAHPYGYGVSVRGVMKGIAAGLIPSHLADEVNGLEVICGGLSDKLNLRAEKYVKAHNTCMTGGSDAHVIWEVGRAVTVGYENQTPLEFLEDVRQKKPVVTGKTRTTAQNILMGACMTPGYIQYTIPVMQVMFRQTAMRQKKYRVS